MRVKARNIPIRQITYLTLVGSTSLRGGQKDRKREERPTALSLLPRPRATSTKLEEQEEGGGTEVLKEEAAGPSSSTAI